MISLASSLNAISRFFAFSSHCQTVITLYPISLSFWIFPLSLIMFLDIFSLQNSVLVAGNVAFLQFSCPCQKHPLTNIIVLYFGKTISGFPGKSFTFFLNLNPLENKYFLTKISVLVSLPEILDMMEERLDFE